MLKAEWNNSPFSAAQQKGFLKTAGRFLGLKKDFLISIAFVSPAVMRRLNRIYRGQDKVTDVLSFSLDGETLGEILVCLPQARKQARANGCSIEEEIVRLLTHGLLHLFGHDHQKERAAKKMFALQEKIIKLCLRQGNL